MRWSVSFYLSSKRNRKFKYLVQTKPMCQNTITNVMKISVGGSTIASTKVRKKFTNHSARKTTVCKLKKANVTYCMFRMHRHCYRPQMYKFPQRLRWSRRRRATMTLSCNIQMPYNENPSAEKKQILYLIPAGVSDITAAVSPLTHRWQRRKKTNFLLHSQKFLHESSYDGVSGKDYRTMMNSR